jgi:hypothetical protein
MTEVTVAGEPSALSMVIAESVAGLEQEWTGGGKGDGAKRAGHTLRTKLMHPCLCRSALRRKHAVGAIISIQR